MWPDCASKHVSRTFRKLFSSRPLFKGGVQQLKAYFPGGGATRYIKKVGMLVENFEIDP